MAALNRQASRQGGFTLLEMVVVVFLVGVSLMLAADLLQEAQVIGAGATRKLQDPLGSLAVARLRADVQGSDDVVGSSSALFWIAEPLSLAGYYPGTLLTYRRQGDRLERLLTDSASGELLAEEVWLKGVESWRWRQLDDGLLDVELTYRRAPELSSYRLDGRPGPKLADVLEVERLRLALRGRGRGVGW